MIELTLNSIVIKGTQSRDARVSLSSVGDRRMRGRGWRGGGGEERRRLDSQSFPLSGKRRSPPLSLLPPWVTRLFLLHSAQIPATIYFSCKFSPCIIKIDPTGQLGFSLLHQDPYCLVVSSPGLSRAYTDLNSALARSTTILLISVFFQNRHRPFVVLAFVFH